MKHLLVALCLLALAAPATTAGAAARGIEGSWTAERSDKHPDAIQFSLHTGKNQQHGSSFDRAAFDGLTAEQVRSSTAVPVQFELVRESGTIAFEGTFRDGHGAGQFAFVSNPDYVKALGRLGVPLEKGDPQEQLFTLTMLDVSTAFIRSMQAIGYDVPLDKYTEFRIFDVDPDYVAEMAKIGFPKLSADKLVETRIHGATPEYIRQMRAAGEDLTLDKYIESRIFQVTPEFAAEMAREGYPDLDRDVLVQFRIHGVTTGFIEELRTLGYSRVPAEKLVEMRIHGVTPEFIRRLDAAGYHKVPIDKMVQMRIFDIDPEMVKALDKDGK